MSDKKIYSIRDFKLSQLTEDEKKTREELLKAGIDLYEGDFYLKNQERVYQGLVLENEYILHDLKQLQLIGSNVDEHRIELSFMNPSDNETSIIEIFINDEGKLEVKLQAQE